jgi:hypothetical protein
VCAKLYHWGLLLTRRGRFLLNLSEKPNDQANKTPKQRNPDYPVSEQFKVLEGFDIYRSNKLIVALVVVDGNFGRDLRMYRWQMRNNAWKVDLCRMSVVDWKWDDIATRAQELIRKFDIKRKGTRPQIGSTE